jgi:Fe-S-cluster containining protein
MTPVQNSCKCCGECCRRGGPVLHCSDLPLIRKDYLKRKDIVQLRFGEPVNDYITGEIKLLDREIFKIRGKSNTDWTCKFLDEKSNLCRIYEYRPLQCRLLKCWDTSELETAYDKNLLSVNDLVRENSGMQELVDFYARKCPVGEILELIRNIPGYTWQKNPRIREKIEFDRKFRQNFLEKTGEHPDICDFYFGRPVEDILPLLKRYLEL